MNKQAELQFSKDAPGSFNTIYRKYLPLLCNYAMKLVPVSAEAKDIVTDVFIRFLDKPRNFHSPGAVRAFLFTSVYHACINWSIQEKRKCRNQESLSIFLSNDWEEYALSRLISKEGSRELFAAVDSMVAQPGKVCKLLYYEGLTLSQVAMRMNLSKNTVKNHQAKGLRILRAALNRERLSL